MPAKSNPPAPASSLAERCQHSPAAAQKLPNQSRHKEPQRLEPPPQHNVNNSITRIQNCATSYKVKIYKTQRKHPPSRPCPPPLRTYARTQPALPRTCVCVMSAAVGGPANPPIWNPVQDRQAFFSYFPGRDEAYLVRGARLTSGRCGTWAWHFAGRIRLPGGLCPGSQAASLSVRCGCGSPYCPGGSHTPAFSAGAPELGIGWPSLALAGCEHAPRKVRISICPVYAGWEGREGAPQNNCAYGLSPVLCALLR